MREILFRAKRKDNGKWIEGYYMYHVNRTPCVAGDSVKPEDEEHIILFDAFSDWNMPRGISYTHVDPSTVCQYTGLTDKNSMKIWEGDIVDILCEVDENGVIEWSDDLARFVVRADGFVADFDNYWGRDLEVIANRFDNPELLGGEAE